ncbi:hypothetical protein FISHEDRAFT_68499 [Fistulina hepatica ATCC 64428]|uniref:Uncharacterized protein n=1 Tax=Fistulina hepatica ATCC 64428 TaxID=1128425 RepID=A0A0D7ASZ6_9AGAR|nr:hypothetical protein FISHEDRAFT_68499 [Fistulina hepatica ATCC 64428]
MDQDENRQQDAPHNTPELHRAPEQHHEDPDATQEQQHQAIRPPIDDAFFVQYIHIPEEIIYTQTPLDYRLKFNKRMERRNAEQNAMSEAYSHDPNNPDLFPGEPMEPLYAFTPHEIRLLATDASLRRQSEEMLAAMGFEDGLPINLRLAISDFAERSTNTVPSTAPASTGENTSAITPDVPDVSAPREKSKLKVYKGSIRGLTYTV